MKKVVLVLIAIPLFVVGFVFGSVRGYGIAEKEYAAKLTPVPVGFPTGYDVLKELNEYRISQDLPELILSQTLCNNIAQRWQNYVDNNSHEGFHEFVVDYMPEGLEVGEILTSGRTAEEMVQRWAGSPSHDLVIKNKSKVCVYSADGYSVALLSN